MNQSTALNPALYRRLLSRFGDVKIRNEGQARVARQRRDLDDNLVTRVEQWGEQYHVACPFCRAGDLAVSYMYAQPDASGRPMLYLAKCFGKDCLGSSRNRDALAGMLKARDEWLTEARVLPGKVLSEEERIPKLPSPLTRLDDLPKGHPARRWLKGQGFYPDQLARLYGLAFCPKSDDSLASNRIIVPITMREKHRGWQALTMSPVAKYKYLSASGMNTSELIYNLDKARCYETPVIVREPLDVWAFGRMALCPLGDSVSDRQLSILKSALRKKDAVLLYPRQERDHPAIQRLRNHLEWGRDGTLLPVEYGKQIPEGRTGRTALRELIAEEAAKRGIVISYATPG